LLVTAGHRTVASALDMVSDAARRVMGVPRAGPRVGAVADLLAIRCATVDQAVAQAPCDRRVWKAGRLVAVRSVTEWIGRS
jgi:cytosine deaminase